MEPRKRPDHKAVRTRSGIYRHQSHVDVASLQRGKADFFAPAVRLARNLGEDRFIASNIMTTLAKIGSFLPRNNRTSNLFAVTDFQDRQDRHGVGVRLRFYARSDRFTLKVIIGYAFPVPKK